MSDKEGADRRESSRLTGLYLLSYVAEEHGVQKTPVAVGRALDISSLGVRAEVFDAIEPGAAVDLEIGIRDRAFVARGKVVWAKSAEGNQFTVGIEFDRPQPELATAVAAEESE